MDRVINSFNYRTFTVSVTRPNNTTPYDIGDIFAEVTSNNHFLFGSASTAPSDGTDLITCKPGVSITLNTVDLLCSANNTTKPDLELWMFHTDIAEVGDNNAFAPSDGEMATRVAVVAVPQSSWKVGTTTAGAGGNCSAFIANIDTPIYIPKGKLFVVPVFRNVTYTPVASEIWTLTLGVTRDVCKN